MRKKIYAKSTDLLLWLVGTVMYALGVNVFATPNNIAQGGFTGLGIILNYIWNLPVGATIFVLNVPLFIISAKRFGKAFIIKTVLVTGLISVVIDISKSFLPIYTGDRFLASLFCGVLIGGGLALIFLRGATSGGTDILAKLLRLRWPHLSIGRVILGVDLIVIALSGIVFQSLESSLYALIAIYTSTRVIDIIIYGSGNGKVLLTVTKKSDEITRAVTQKLQRGVTVLQVKGGYTNEQKNMVICAVRSSEVSKLNSIIREADENAFTIISEAGEILGEGFGQRKI